MAATTKVNTEWAVRLLIIAIAALVFGTWFTYDGAVGWPKENEKRILAHEKHETAKGDVKWTLRDDWAERLEQAGYSVNPGDPPEAPRSQQDIQTQFVYAAICFPVAILLLINLQFHASRKLYTDEKGLHHGRKFIAFDQIQRIDYDRWDSKGIAVVHGNDDTMIKLDDWKYKGAADVLADVETHVPHLTRSAQASDSGRPDASDTSASDASTSASSDESAEPSPAKPTSEEAPSA